MGCSGNSCKMTDKRISLLVFLPHLSVGGAERVVVTLLKNLDRSRFDPTLVVIGDDKGPLTKDLPADLETIFLLKKSTGFHSRNHRAGTHA